MDAKNKRSVKKRPSATLLPVTALGIAWLNSNQQPSESADVTVVCGRQKFSFGLHHAAAAAAAFMWQNGWIAKFDPGTTYALQFDPKSR